MILIELLKKLGVIITGFDINGKYKNSSELQGEQEWLNHQVDMMEEKGTLTWEEAHGLKEEIRRKYDELMQRAPSEYPIKDVDISETSKSFVVPGVDAAKLNNVYELELQAFLDRNCDWEGPPMLRERLKAEFDSYWQQVMGTGSHKTLKRETKKHIY